MGLDTYKERAQVVLNYISDLFHNKRVKVTSCYSQTAHNTYKLLKKESYCYIVIGGEKNFPVHAWVEDKKGNVIDTYSGPRSTRFPRKEYIYIGSDLNYKSQYGKLSIKGNAKEIKMSKAKEILENINESSSEEILQAIRDSVDEDLTQDFANKVQRMMEEITTKVNEASQALHQSGLRDLKSRLDDLDSSIKEMRKLINTVMK